MSDTLTAAPAPSSAGDRDAGRIRVGRTDYVVERPSARKASTALRLLRRVSATVKTVTRELGRFEREYARDHALELDRVQARMRFPGEPVIDDEGELVRDADGEPVMVSRLDAMSEADWERAGHVLRLPQLPSREERFGAVFELVNEDAEDELWRVLALFTLTNAEVADAKRGQRLDEELERRADELLDDGDLAELLELAIVIAETVDRQFTARPPSSAAAWETWAASWASRGRRRPRPHRRPRTRRKRRRRPANGRRGGADAELELEADLAYRFGREFGWPADVTLDTDYGLLLAIGERIADERRRAEARRVEDAMGYHPDTETPGNAARQRMLELAAAQAASVRAEAQ
jgi:hypothetical protein